MKMIKILAANVFAVMLGQAAFASQSNPAVVINVVGSTAFRYAVSAAEVVACSAHGTPAVMSYSDSGKGFGVTFANASKSGHSNVYGFLADGTEVMYRNSWTGSVAGLVDLTSDNTTLTYIPTTAGMSAAPGTLAAATDTGAPNVTMADTQLSDIEAVVTSAGTAATSPINFLHNLKSASVVQGGRLRAAAGDPGVAAITFAWVAGSISSGSQPFTGSAANMTTDVASALVSNGNVPLSVFTGNENDSINDNYVLLVGRSEDSASRVTAFAEAQSGGVQGTKGYGQNTFQYMLKQSGVAYPTSAQSAGYPSISTVSAGITSFQLWPTPWGIAGEPQLTWSTTGHSGYNNGGDVASILSSPNPVSGSSFSSPTGAPALDGNLYFVGYLGTGDLSGLSGNYVILNYNGVSCISSGTTLNPAPVIAGQYGFWGYEQLYFLAAGSASNACSGAAGSTGTMRDAADGLADAIWGTATANMANSGVNIPTDMDGGFIAKNPAAGSYAN
jgi:hypothetical protein